MKQPLDLQVYIFRCTQAFSVFSWYNHILYRNSTLQNNHKTFAKAHLFYFMEPDSSLPHSATSIRRLKTETKSLYSTYYLKPTNMHHWKSQVSKSILFILKCFQWELSLFVDIRQIHYNFHLLQVTRTYCIMLCIV